MEFISAFVEFLNVGKIMNKPQIKETALFILQYFPHFNLADLKVFFDKMKLGHFGKFYDSVDGQLILSKMEEYSQDRMNEFEQIRLAKHKEELKKNPIGEGYHPSVIDAIKKAVGEKKFFTPQVKEPKTPTEAELFHKRALRQFDNLFTKYGIQIGLRALKIGQTVFTIDTFIDRKINNIINSKY